MIVGANEIMTGLGVTKLSEYAHDGLPIIFYGGLPSKFEGYDQPGYASTNSTISSLTSLKNVHVTSPSESLAGFLVSISISPRTAVSANGTWYTYWRDGSSIDYVYIYNDASGLPLGQGHSTGYITFETTGVPYTYNAWTGEISPVVAYKQSATHTTIWLELAGEQITIIAFKQSGSRPFYVQSLPESTAVTSSSSSSFSISILTTADEAGSVVLSNGTEVTLPPASTSPFPLTNWSLTIESWTAPSNIYDLNPIATRSNLSTISNLQSLDPWYTISDSLANVSGRGYYSTEFQWPPANTLNTEGSSTDGVFIDLGAIVHTARVLINGHAIPPLDIIWARADISQYLVKGSNSVEVVVSTPLGNALRAIWDSLVSSGKSAVTQVADPPGVADYGLVFPVQIIPYTAHRLFT
jgi:hypothetical protein